MSKAKRKGLEFSINQIGNALFAFEDLIGSTSKPNSARLDFENNYIRLRGSTIFNDYDLSKKDPLNISSSEFNTFDSFETSDLALQGGEIIVKNEITNFTNYSTWNPSRYSPPSPEGWLVYDYNAWSNYIPKYNSSGIANTNLLIYDIYGEPNSGLARTSYDYPVRFTGFGNTYERVPLFEFASWVSVPNFGGTTSDEINIIIPKSYFGGAYNIDPYTNAPIDMLIMSHSNLKSTSIDDPITFAGTMGTKGVSDVLDILAYRVSETDLNGTLTNNNSDCYKFDINLPIGYTWSEADYRHFVFYWGSFDEHIESLKKKYSRSENTIDVHYGINLNSVHFIYPKKNFFLKNITNSFQFDKTGVNDNNIYLYNKNNYLNTYKESYFNSVKQPFRYKLNENIKGSSIGKTNSLIGFRNLKSQEYIAFIIACKNDGFIYDDPKIDLEIFYSFPFSIESIPQNWNDLDFYPDIPENYIEIAKIVAKNSEINRDTPIFLNNSSYVKNDLTIVHIDMVPENVLKKSIAIPDISLFFSNSFKELSEKIRKKDYSNFFSFIGQKLNARFLRYNLNNIRIANQFIAFSSEEYKTLHALSKLPYDELLQNDNEPKSIQCNINGANLISNFSRIPPCLNFAGFNSTSLYFNNLKFNTNAEFEIYLEKNIDEIDDKLDNNRGLEKDYSFRIKFSNSSNEFTVKDLFVNASKYFLNDYEYLDRKNKNLSLDGYFNSTNIEDISEFKLNSYAGVIPDLKLEEYRSITNKYNSPNNLDRITIEDFEANLVSQNPLITKDQIINEKFGFGITDAFYEVDLSKPSDFYNSIVDLGITITNYRENKNIHWVNNTQNQSKVIELSEIQPAINIKDLRYDSFIISKSGFATTDNSINILENINNQRILSSTGSTINKTIRLGSHEINSNKVAFKIINDQKQKIKSFKIKLKKTSDYINKNASIKSFIYSDINNSPNEVLATGSSIYLKDIAESFEDFYFEIDYNFYPNKIYWIVLDIPQLPPVYDPYVKGLINLNDQVVTGAYDNKTNSTPDFTRYLIGAELGFGSTVGTAISNWYTISSIGSSSSMTIASTGQTLSNQLYSIRYKFELGIEEASLSGAPSNLSIYNSATGWSSYSGTPYIQFYKPEQDIYASFNRDFTKSNLILPPPNKFREKDTNKVDDYWSFNCKQFFNDQKLFIYPRSLYLKKIEVVGSGTSNSNLITIDQANYNDSIMVGLGLSNSNFYGAGTSITNIIYDSSNLKYNLYLSSVLTSTFTNSVVGIGTDFNTYIKRANDIHIILKYNKFSGIATTQITLPKNPTWLSYWYKSNKFNYKTLNKNEIADLVGASYDLNINNFYIDNSEYMVGYSIGDFYVKSGVGLTFDFRFYSSGGLKVFLNDNSIPVINNWTNTSSMIGYTFNASIASTSEKIKLEIQYNNSQLKSGSGQTIIAQWKSSTGSTWANIDDSFYSDFEIQPIQIDSDDIQSIQFMYCGKTNDLFNQPNLGSPINDRLIIRSK